MDYDLVAPRYDRRYERNSYDGVQKALQRFIGRVDSITAAEVGCGTGHWLAELQGRARSVVGLDPSAEMLKRARTAAPAAHLVRARAESLPWTTARIDRLFCINAFHHFADPEAFVLEAHRVLRPAGALMIVGLDPHTRLDSWWIYDYFPSALEADRRRYMPAARIRDRLRAAGFVDMVTELAQHLPANLPFAVAVEQGFVDRDATSQLSVLSDEEYESGLRQLRAEQPVLHADLRLYATVARTP